MRGKEPRCDNCDRPATKTFTPLDTDYCTRCYKKILVKFGMDMKRLSRQPNIIIAVSKFYASVYYGHFLGENHKTIIIGKCINIAKNHGHSKFQQLEFDEKALKKKNFVIFRKKR